MEETHTDEPKVKRARPRAAARKALSKLLSRFTFARIVSVTVADKNRDESGNIKYYHAIAQNVKTRESIFLKSSGRARGLGVMIGPAALMDQYDVGDFPSHCVPPPPPVGSLVVGTTQASKKASARIKKEFLQWGANAEPVSELNRVTKKGTRMGPKRLRECL